MINGKLSKFCKRISIRATPKQVYEAWNSTEGLESWFLRKAEFTRPNGSVRKRKEPIQKYDTYHWLWHGYGDEVFEKRKVLASNGTDSLSFIFTADCVVSVQIKMEQGETICELTQERIPSNPDLTDHLYVLCGEGWTFYLTNLKSILEGGVDLRNKNVNLTRLINA